MAFEIKTLKNFIGGGITLPIKLVNGKPPIESGFDLIRASIRMILSWEFGTRFFLNEFGSELNSLLEEPNDHVLENLISTFVTDAVTRWENRVQLLDVQVQREESISKISITLTYRIVNTQREDTFVFPFYRNIIY